MEPNGIEGSQNAIEELEAFRWKCTCLTKDRTHMSKFSVYTSIFQKRKLLFCYGLKPLFVRERFPWILFACLSALEVSVNLQRNVSCVPTARGASRQRAFHHLTSLCEFGEFASKRCAYRFA